MAFSLSNWFKGKPNGSGDSTPEGAASATAPTSAHAESNTIRTTVTRTIPSVRKVVPNSVQPVSLREPSARGPISLTSGPSAAAGTVRAVTALVPPRKINFGNPAAAAAQAPAAAEPSPAPFVPPVDEGLSVPDVPVSLEVGDFIDRLPPTLLSGAPVDRSRRVEFRSSELYSDLSKGRASVPASVIYEKCPELFSRPVTETEDSEVALPLQKLVEQLSPSLQTRADQLAEDNVGEIETPFLQVAMEDNARLPTAVGTSSGAIRAATPLTETPPAVEMPPRPPNRTGQIQTISSPKVVQPEAGSVPAAPNAQTLGPISTGKRPPSTVRASVAGGKIRLSGPTVPSRIALAPGAATPPVAGSVIPPINGADLPPSATQRIATPMPPLPASANSPSHQVSKKTARIQIPPISLRTPASPGAAAPRPSVVAPPSAPVPLNPGLAHQSNGGGEPNAPTNFRSTPPPSVKPMPHSFAPPPNRPTFPPPVVSSLTPVAAVAPAPAAAPAPVADDRKIVLGLAAVLRGLSSSLLAVDPSAIADDVRMELPFALVEPQLSTGRVSVSRAVFTAALPAEYKNVLDEAADLPELPLPLQEVFQNLPTNALNMRADQVEDQITHLFPTPFSQKAEEDAQRLGVGTLPANGTAAVSKDSSGESENQAAAGLPADRPLPMDPVVPAEEEEVAPPAPAQEDLAVESARDIQLDLDDAPELIEAKAPSAEDASEAPLVNPESKSEPSTDEQSSPEVAVNEPAALSEPAPAETPAPLAARDVAVVPDVPSTHEKTSMPSAPSSAPVAPVVTKGRDSDLQVLFMTEDELDAKTVVRLVSNLPGLNGCAVMFGDGLRLAGNFPAESQSEGFSAMAPPFFKRARTFSHDAGLGSLEALTLQTDLGLCSFLMHADICLGVRHIGRGFMPGVREKLEIVVRELARMYTTPPADPID